MATDDDDADDDDDNDYDADDVDIFLVDASGAVSLLGKGLPSALLASIDASIARCLQKLCSPNNW